MAKITFTIEDVDNGSVSIKMSEPGSIIIDKAFNETKNPEASYMYAAKALSAIKKLSDTVKKESSPIWTP